jgi:hypothetical protein
MVVIVAAVISIAIFFMRETHKPTILRRQIKQSRRRESSPDQCASSPSSQRQERSAMFREFITRILLRPIHMACVEPVVGFFTLYIAINFGMVYGKLRSSSQIYNEQSGLFVQTKLTKASSLFRCIPLRIRQRI